MLREERELSLKIIEAIVFEFCKKTELVEDEGVIRLKKIVTPQETAREDVKRAQARDPERSVYQPPQH